MTSKPALVFLFGAACLAVACGGAAPSEPKAAAPPNADAEPGATKEPPRTVDEAIEEIAAQQAVLEESIRTYGLPRPPTAAPESSSSSNAEPQGGASAVREEKAADVCVVRCRAFTSMKRAVEALCRLIGEREARCLSTRRTLEVTAGRVASCGCR